jgi:hypothetical protein
MGVGCAFQLGTKAEQPVSEKLARIAIAMNFPRMTNLLKHKA